MHGNIRTFASAKECLKVVKENLKTYGIIFWEYPKVCVNLQTDVR